MSVKPSSTKEAMQADAVPEPTDHKDDGPMGDYDDERKPDCPDHGQTWIVAVGRDTCWNWKCTNCQREWKP